MEIDLSIQNHLSSFTGKVSVKIAVIEIIQFLCKIYYSEKSPSTSNEDCDTMFLKELWTSDDTLLNNEIELILPNKLANIYLDEQINSAQEESPEQIDFEKELWTTLRFIFSQKYSKT